MQYIPPFHPYAPKSLGQKVKLQKCLTDDSKGFFYGEICEVRQEKNRQEVRVAWEVSIPDMDNETWMLDHVPIAA